MDNREIIRRKYYAIPVTLQSPHSTSNSISDSTDADVLRNANGKLFLPGSSIAGAWRDYLKQKKDEDGIMGYSKDKEGKMSPISISDLYFIHGAKVAVRDGVKLGEEKDVISKFDFEIVETGASGILFFDYVERSGDKWKYDETILDIIHAMERGDIRFGANKTRGMGRITFKKVYEVEFTKNNVDDWISFLSKRQVSLENIEEKYKEGKTPEVSLFEFVEQYVADTYQTKICQQEKNQKQNGIEDSQIREPMRSEPRYVTCQVALKLHGGSSIRRYSTKPMTADYEHITTNDAPVIPGSSWNGAIRSDVRRILNDLGCKDTKHWIDYWFGCIDDDAHQSRIIIGESILEYAGDLPIVRNKINPFSGGTFAGGLYTEIAYFKGKTVLEIKVRKDDPHHEALLALLDIVIQDIIEGYLPVGGLVSVGRGLWEADTTRHEGDFIRYSEAISKEKNREALRKFLQDSHGQMAKEASERQMVEQDKTTVIEENGDDD